MRKHVICGTMFDGLDGGARTDQTIVIDDDRIAYAGSSAGAPDQKAGEPVIDHSGDFVMPGLIDIHVHLSYGDGQANEDIDMYASPEYRALRGLRAAQTVLRAGYTSIADPASTGRCSPGVRDAINAGMFKGPRITSAGRQVTARQGLGDWYPTWIGVPESSVGVLVRGTDEAIEEIRMQVKDRVDFIKIALDGLQRKGFRRRADGLFQPARDGRDGRRKPPPGPPGDYPRARARGGADLRARRRGHHLPRLRDGRRGAGGRRGVRRGAVARLHLHAQHDRFHPPVGSLLQMAARAEPATGR